MEKFRGKSVYFIFHSFVAFGRRMSGLWAYSMMENLTI